MMSTLSGLGFRRLLDVDTITPHQHVISSHPLSRILRFLNLSIDDICNCPIARSKVAGYYKLHRQIERARESRELEQQWSGPASYARG